MNIAVQGFANTLPFCVTDLRRFMEQCSLVTGLHVHVIDPEEGKVWLEGTHGDWDLYATVLNDRTQTMDDELVDLENLVSYPDPDFVVPQGLTQEGLEALVIPRVTFLKPGEYVLFQWMGVKDGEPNSGVYGINSAMESVTYNLQDMVQRAHAVLGTPEPGSLLNPDQPEPDTSGPAI